MESRTLESRELEKKRVLIISQHSAEGSGGPIDYLLLLIRFLRDEGLSVSLFSEGGLSSPVKQFLASNSIEVVHGAEVLARVRRVLRAVPVPLRYLIEAASINRWVRGRQHRFTHVFVAMCSPGRYLIPVCPLGRAVYVFHSEPVGLKHMFAGAYFRNLIGKDAKLIAVSRWVKQSLNNVWRVNPDDPRLFLVPHPAHKINQPKPYVPHERTKILMAGSANEFKNPWFWLDLAKAVLEECEDQALTFRWIGDGPLLEDMRSWVSINALGERVELPGFVSDPTEDYNSARLYLQLSKRESMGFAAIDALRAGLPIITTRVGGLQEVVEENGNGFFAHQEEFDVSKSRIVNLLSDYDTLKKFSSRSSELHREQFSEVVWQASMRSLLLN